MKFGDQGRDMATPKPSRCSDAQVAAGFKAARTDARFGIGHFGQQALTVFEECRAFVCERDASRGAHQELDAQVRF